MRIQFLGANRQVTGSRYYLEAGGLRLLIDCGLFQERDFQGRNWTPPQLPLEKIDYLLLTHAHLDHCGLIPRMVREGLSAPILATPPSVDLAAVVLRDSARIQEEDAAYKRKRHAREGRQGPRPAMPLYTVGDAEDAVRLFRQAPYHEPVKLNDRVTVTYHDAGHILGSSMLEIAVEEDGRGSRIVFSGDIGQWDKPLIRDPSLLDVADYVVMESTYGDREHERPPDIEAALAEIINETVRSGGNLLVPTFAIERAQELIYHLGRLVDAKRIPRLMVFLDSPMAVNATEIFHRYQGLMDEHARDMIAAGNDPLEFPSLHMSRSSNDSKAINQIRGSCIVMAGAGMCTGGRIKHHLANNLHRPESAVLFVGYQAEGTLGRQILERRPEVRIFGRMIPVRAKIHQLQGLSAHADHSGLLRWLGHFKPAPRHVFLTHGEESVAMGLAAELRGRGKWRVDVPAFQQVFELA